MQKLLPEIKRMLESGRSGIFYSGLGPCYRNIATEMGTFRGAKNSILATHIQSALPQ